MEKFYTLKEIEDNLKVSNRTLKRYIKAGKLKAVRIGGSGKYVVSESNYNDFISGKWKKPFPTKRMTWARLYYSA